MLACVPCHNLLQVVCAQATNLFKHVPSQTCAAVTIIQAALTQDLFKLLSYVGDFATFHIPACFDHSSSIVSLHAHSLQVCRDRGLDRDIAVVSIFCEICMYMLLSQQLALHTAVAPCERSVLSCDHFVRLACSSRTVRSKCIRDSCMPCATGISFN